MNHIEYRPYFSDLSFFIVTLTLMAFVAATQPAVMGKVLGIVYRTIATHLIHQAGYNKATAQTGAVTLIQCFGSALNAHIHFHMIFLDGVYIDSANKSRARVVKFRGLRNEQIKWLA